ncbi:MAG: hypothetical protein WD342_09040 [Verrucomicrobiales bacterium]
MQTIRLQSGFGSEITRHCGSGTSIGRPHSGIGQGISVPNCSGVADNLRRQCGQTNFTLSLGSLMSAGVGTMKPFEHSGHSVIVWNSCFPAESRAEQ